jgi:hypothetical protein
MPLAFLVAALLALPAQEPDLRTVLARAGAYAATYQRDFSLLLADERYSQELKAGAAAERRVLVSEFALVRTVNVPTLALEFLETAAQQRSRFRKAAEETVEGVRAWVVSFEERARPYLIRTPGGRDVRTKGLAWIDPDTGRVLKTQLDPQIERGLAARITTAYAPDERLRLWVPVEMQESYETASNAIAGTATYTNFRRFETDARILGVK